MRTYKFIMSLPMAPITGAGPTPPPSVTSIQFDTEGAGSYLPLNMANADCARFVAEWQEGATVYDANGVVIPYSDAALAALNIISLT